MYALKVLLMMNTSGKMNPYNQIKFNIKFYIYFMKFSFS